MKKTLIALAVLGAAAGAAHAQSNVTIYGIIDTGFIKKSSQDVQLGENVNSRIGFRGVEDLGSGQKAIFALEKRMNVNDGTNNSSDDKDWEGAAYIGLKGDQWGQVRVGRVNELTTETIRKFDPFYQYGVASMIYGTQRSSRIDNVIRYDSPTWAGFKFGLLYQLGENMDSESRTSEADAIKDDGADNDGYGIMLGWDYEGFSAVANWSRLADSNKSSVWNVGLAYRFGPAKVELLYQQTTDKGYKNGSKSSWAKSSKDAYLGAGVNDLKESQWLLGLEWKLGPGRLNASAQYMEVEAHGSADMSDKDIYKYAIGYTYDLSKRTAIYGNIAYTDYDDEQVARVFGDYDDGTYGVQIGITHKF